MKKGLIWIGISAVAVLTAGWFSVRAGNRADINADRAVNAADLTVLSNILAGNIDLAGYDLPGVVVVAARGGDFTDPAAAADWVAGQSPSPANRFVILVAPGKYTVDRVIQLPSYTTLQGYGPHSTWITRYNPVIQGYWSDVVFINTRTGVTVQNLALETTENDGPNNVLRANGAYDLRLKNLLLVNKATSAQNYGLTLSQSHGALVSEVVIDNTAGLGSGLVSGCNLIDPGEDIVIEHCQIMAAGPSSGYHVFGIQLDVIGMEVLVRDCIIRVHQPGTSYQSCAISGGYTGTTIRVYDSILAATAAQSGNAFSIALNNSATGRFFNCELTGLYSPAAGTIRCNCYDADGNHIPEP